MYSGARSLAVALAVLVQAGNGATVSGIIRTPDGRPLITGAVAMRAIGDEAAPAIRSQDVRILPSGSFTFRNVPPGDYQIRARGDVGGDSPALFATFKLRVEAHDIGNVDITLVPGARLEGHVVVEPSKRTRTPLPPRMRVRAPLADGSTFGEALTGDVRPDGSYAIRGLMTGTHVIALEGLRPPWVLQSVTWRGQDITDAGITAESHETYSEVRVTISDVASEITGRVRDAKGAPVANAAVIVIPTAPQFWTRTSRRLRLIHADAAGRYSVRGLPDGEYHLVALPQIEDSEAYRRDRLEELARGGTPLAIKDRTVQTLDVTLFAPGRLTETTSR